MPHPKPDIGYIPTPQAVVDAMLDLAKVTSEDILYDLGSGDGRIVITAAQRFGTRGVGIDIDPERIQAAGENARKAGVSDRVQFYPGNLFESDFHEATVVTLYLLPHLNLRVLPRLLSQLKPGTRILSHNFDMDDWQPERVVKVQSEEEDSTIYCWIVPEHRNG